MPAANKRRFTDQMLERMRPPTKGRLELGDEVVPGLVVRVTPRGVKSFSVIYKVPGEGGVSAAGRCTFAADGFDVHTWKRRDEFLRIVGEGREDGRPSETGRSWRTKI